MLKGLSFQTICLLDAPDSPGQLGSNHTPPIFSTSTFVYPSAEKAMDVFAGKEDALIYSRWNNPNFSLVEDKLAALESFDFADKNAKALVFSSGMAAIYALLDCLLNPEDEILTQGNLYGTTTELMNTQLRNKGVITRIESLTNPHFLKSFLNNHPKIKVIYLETPANPTLECVPIEAICKVAQESGVKTVVDNTFSTPWIQRPLSLGADFVVHSTTKFLNGHGTALGGAVISLDERFIQNRLWQYRKVTGAISSPFDAWLLNLGLKTLPLRMNKHCSNAAIIADFLSNHPQVTTVNYPGLENHPSYSVCKKQMSQPGGVLSFELAGGFEAGIRLLNSLQICKLTASIGTPDTIIQHPASMTHVKVPREQRLSFGISDGLIRLSVGLEDPKDIIEDLKKGLT